MSKKTMALFLVLVLAFSFAVPAFAAESGETAGNVQVTRLDDTPKQEREGSNSRSTQPHDPPAYGADEKVRAIVIMEEAPTASAITTFALRRPTESDLLESHEELREEMSSEGIDFELNYDYTTLLNGMSVTVEYGDLDAISEMPGVASVHVANTYVQIEDVEQPSGEQQMDHSNDLTGLTTLFQDGYQGTGMVIAVLDSGITPEHEVFGTDPTELTVTEEDVADFGYGVYLSAKIPFYHDYYETRVNGKSNDEADTKAKFGYDAGGHGTHVAGIAAGHAKDQDGAVTFQGAAPDAQILAMKVYADDTSNGSTTTDLCFAALEDAYKLGADVINMSIGWYADFTYDYDLEYVLRHIYETLEANGVICCVSAGNYYSIGDANGYNEDPWVYGDYADYGTLCSPAAYPGTLAVAAAENSAYLADTILQVDGNSILYIDDTTEDNSDGKTFAEFAEELNGEPVNYVVLPYLGYANEYVEVDIPENEPWVAVIQRGADPNINEGSFRFAEKIQIAAEQGASAAIIYNNVQGDLYMDLTPDTYAIPTITISKEAFDAYLLGTESGTMTFPTEVQEIPNSDAGRMTDMSSWGATPDLQIGPEIAAVGGHVRSALGGTADQYVVYSGTSMAAPNMAGAMATLLQYLKENGYKDKAERGAMAKALVESTATTLYLWDDYDNLYSPRKQGAGLFHIKNATEASAYITDPLCNLYDNQTGEFTINFTVKNLTGENRTYNIDLDVMCDYIDDYGGRDMTSYMLYEDYGDYTRGGQKTVTVPANGEADVTVTIQLSEAWMSYFDWYGGNFIEGYVRLSSEDGEEIHATYMGFYGDWTAGSVLEQYDWRDYYSYRDTYENTALNWAYVENIDTWESWVDAGENYFLNWHYDDYDSDWNYDEDRIAIPGPSSSDYAYCNGLYLLPINIRNARSIVMVISDAETGETYYADSLSDISKVYYYGSDYGWWTDAYFTYDGTDFNGDALPNNIKVNVSVYASIDYGEDALADVDWTDADLDLYEDYLEWSFPCTIDSELPELKSAFYSPNAGTLTLTVYDNQYLANVNCYGWSWDPDNGDWVPVEIADDYRLFYNENSGVESTVTFDVSGCEYVELYIDDYATNESYYWLELEDYHDHDLTHVEAKNAACEEDGNIEYWYCEGCNGYFADEAGEVVITEADTVIEALGHDWSEWETITEPTDYTDGLEVRTCSVCGETDTRIIPALGHVHDLTCVEAAEASCEENGNIAYWQCEICGRYFADEAGEVVITAADTVIEALGHDWGEWETITEPTDSTNGLEARTCSVCGETDTRVIPAPGHVHDLTYVEAVEATCEEKGRSAYWYCEECGGYFADEEGETQISEFDIIVPSLGHDWGEWEIVREATEDEEGLRVRTCFVCGEEEKYSIPRLPHTHQLTYVPAADAACEEDGNIEYWYCKKCGKYFSDADAENEITEAETVLAAHGHDTYLDGYKAPTSWKPGYSGDLVCRICGEVIEKGHVIEPTGDLYDPIPPTRPTQPEKPTEPEPAKPTEPVAPVEPTQPAIPDVPGDSMNFVDVSAGSWYYADVEYVFEKGLMNGVDDTHFSPETNLTRAMVVTILFRMGDETSVGYTGVFSDVADGMWYTNPVEWAAKNNIVIGYPNGEFGPEDAVTREQLAAILYRYALYKGYDVTGSADLSVYADSSEISSYAVTAMQWAVAESLINGSNGKLQPTENATRAQVAVIIHRFLEMR